MLGDADESFCSLKIRFLCLQRLLSLSSWFFERLSDLDFHSKVVSWWSQQHDVLVCVISLSGLGRPPHENSFIRSG